MGYLSLPVGLHAVAFNSQALTTKQVPQLGRRRLLVLVSPNLTLGATWGDLPDVLLVIPLAFDAGNSLCHSECLHIWIIMPFVKTCLMVLPSVQTIWKSVTDVVVAPLCTSVGRIFSSVSLQLSHD
uniref:Caveolin n=1 Tax=Cavia porcellus TaxID=10141 RepID=A0A286XNM2_CAVPO|nr:caveolin-2 [Cavia porcellus]